MQQRFLLQILLLTQHVSGTTMPIIRSSSKPASILQTGHITLSSTPDKQLENHSTKYHRQQPLYNTLELLMMGIVVPETCWASNKICNKNLCCISLAFYFHIQYVMFIAFRLPQWLSERAWMLHIYVHCMSWFFYKSSGRGTASELFWIFTQKKTDVIYPVPTQVSV